MALHSQISFQRGDKVEVCSKVPGFLGYYFEATVVAKKAGQQLCGSVQEPGGGIRRVFTFERDRNGG